MSNDLIYRLRTRKFIVLALGLALLVALSLLPAAARPAEQRANAPQAQEKEGAPDCSLLERPEVVSLMSFGLQTRLAVQCGQLGMIPGAPQGLDLRGPFNPAAPLGIDVQLNNHLLDPGPKHQNESDLAIGGPAGNIICSNYNDSGGATSTYMGFSRSTDGGATFSDQGNFQASFGDPAMIYRRADGFFYAASLGSSGLRLYKSTDLCQTFNFQNNIHTGSGDDKEMMRVDNNPASPFYGRMYVCWTNFGVSGFPIQATWSSDAGVTWSAPVNVSAATDNNEQGCWPAVAPNGDVYIVYINGYTSGTNDIKVARSTNGGVSWSAPINIASGIAEAGLSTSCGNSGTRPAMNGFIRTWAMPQVAVGPNGWVHVAYTKREGSDRGNIFYQRSTDNGATWSAPVRINDDTTTNDQWHSTISVNQNGTVLITWYDRREAGAQNRLYRYYAALSYNNGTTWEPNVAVSDVLSDVPPLNPNFDPNIRDCYYGDYDVSAVDAAYAYAQWSDSRNIQGGIPQPDMFMDRIPLQPDFTLAVDPQSRNVCAPATTAYTVTVGSVLGFNAPVTLSALNVPGGTTVNFTPNPVVPPGTSSMGVNVGATAAGVYNIGVNGQTVTRTHTVTVTLGVYTAIPGVPVLVSPPNGATNVQLRPTFQWQAASQAASYQLQVDDDPNFGSPVIDVTVTGTSYTPSANLLSNTTYYWRVRAINACGQSSFSETWSFTTMAGTGNCPAPGYYECADLVSRAWITATTPSGITGDDQVVSLPIGFTFNFYGTGYTTVNVSSNGNLQFTTSSTAFSNVCPLPSATLGRAILPFWDDLYPPAGGGIYYSTTGTAPNRIFTVEFRDIQHFPGTPSGITFEVQLEEATGDIYMLFRDTDFGDPSINNGASASVGLQDTSTALEYNCNEGLLFNGLNIRWYRSVTPTPTPTGATPTATPVTPTATPVTPTPTPVTPTATPVTPTATPVGPTPTPTPCAPQPRWVERAPIPVNRIRVGASAFTPNGKIYLLGGRQDDVTFVDTIYEYDPVANSWTLKSATLPDLSSANAAAVQLTGPSGPRIYVIGGSAAGSVTTGDVRVYDPATDTVTVLTSDPWPAGATYLPGGWAVYNNILYIFGGFQPNVGMTDAIWRFDPMAAPGAKWTQLSTTLGLARGYIATAVLDGYIYVVGGSQFSGGTLTNEVIAERFDPATNTISAIADLPIASSNFHAYAYNSSTGYPVAGKLYVAGGQFPTAMDTVQVYDPATNTWTTGANLLYATRNYGHAQMSGYFYAFGGYATTPSNYTQRYEHLGPCPPTSVEVAQFQGESGPARNWLQSFWLIPAALVVLVSWALLRRRLRARV